jgi:hypothetical protein
MRANPYTAVDLAINAWAAEHQLQVCTVYKDYEVRSVDIPRHRRWLRQRYPFQIWIDVPDDLGHVGVHAWDRRRQRLDLYTRTEAVRGALDEALAWVQSHM